MTTSTVAHSIKTTTHNAGGVSFSLALDQSSYVTRPGTAGKLTATLVLRCPENAPLTLSFANGQEFDIAIDDAAGNPVALWSTGQRFFDHVQAVTVDGERRWTATMALPELPDAFLPARPGGSPETASSYTATAYLKTAPAAATRPSGGVHPDIAPQPVAPPSVAGGTASATSEPTMPRWPYSAMVAFTVHSVPVVLEGASKATA